MAILDLSGLTDAQLTTQIAETISAISRTMNASSYRIGSRSLGRVGLEDLKSYLSDLSREQEDRGDKTGGTGVVEFGEPE